MASPSVDPKKVEPAKMSQEELNKQGLGGGAKPQGHKGNFLHQEGGSMGSRRFVLVMAGMLVAGGLGSWMYYTASKPREVKSDDRPREVKSDRPV